MASKSYSATCKPLSPQTVTGTVSKCNCPSEAEVLLWTKIHKAGTAVENSQMLSEPHTKGCIQRRGKTMGDLDREGQPGLRKGDQEPHWGASECLNIKKGHGLGFLQSE